jgi:hypothetical protein
MGPSQTVLERGKRAGSRPNPLVELTLITVLFSLYKLGRVVAAGHVAKALANADLVWHLERLIRLPGEDRFQGLMLQSESLTKSANVYYATVHFPITIAFLVWMWACHPETYRWARNVLVILTGSALAVHLVFPLAPPRLVPDVWMVDTGHLVGPSVYGPPASDTLSNQYAAMPSLHVGWAIVVAIGIARVVREPWGYLGILHPVITLFVVVGTANHYWLDGIVVGLLLVPALVMVRDRPTEVPHQWEEGNPPDEDIAIAC